MSLLIGPLIDRWSAAKIFPHTLLPAVMGLATLVLCDGGWVPHVYLLLVGMSQGMAGPVMTSVWAEVYGVESLGATALGPLALGSMLGLGFAYQTLVLGCVGLAFIAILLGWIARARILRAGHGPLAAGEIP